MEWARDAICDPDARELKEPRPSSSHQVLLKVRPRSSQTIAQPNTSIAIGARKIGPGGGLFDTKEQGEPRGTVPTFASLACCLSALRGTATPTASISSNWCMPRAIRSRLETSLSI